VKIAGPVALIVDWKTGKVLENSEQLALMAQCVFAHFPQVMKVRSEFVWLQFDATTREVKLKAEFEFPQNAYVSVKQAEIIDPRYGHRTHATSISLRGEKVTIRSIRLDYASCFVPSSKVLALVPLVLIIKHGVQRRTRWDVVEDNLADDDAEELDANLFKDL
jgi:hypothetical protein